ncbi:MAG: hypothetical protein JJ913_08120 [Rhizobiaceae bacterium]|nr:hypothetical protein [Rhizobiaceae bacterium]
MSPQLTPQGEQAIELAALKICVSALIAQHASSSGAVSAESAAARLEELRLVAIGITDRAWIDVSEFEMSERRARNMLQSRIREIFDLISFED